MNYTNRHLEPVIEACANEFAVVLVTGARGVGKATLSAHLFGDLAVISFGDPTQVVIAKNDPKSFFPLLSPPIILDEIQHIGELLRYIKMEVDRRKMKGLYIMGGSQQYSMMQNVTESLAGRVGILQLHGLSLREQHSDSYCQPFIPTREQIMTRDPGYSLSPDALWQIIHRGSYPELAMGTISWDRYYGSYVKTCIERDVVSLTQIGDT